MRISVLNDFSELPALRHCSISDDSGEEFYHKILNKAFHDSYTRGEKLVVDLDNTGGYAPSFLDEAFGNLVYDFTLDVVKSSVEIISNQVPHWKDMIETKTYVKWEERRQKKERPKVTANHAAWYRLIDKKMQLNVWEEPAA